MVNLSSGMGQLSDMGSGAPAYRISKTALNAVTRILAGTTPPAGRSRPSAVTRSARAAGDSAAGLVVPAGGAPGGRHR